jgi:hypothetical protein
MTEKAEHSNTAEQIQCINSLPVDVGILFSNHKNVYKHRLEKSQRKMLQKLSFLRPFLMPGENIWIVTTGCSPFNFLEQFLGGAIMQLYKRAIFVFTNFRILHIPAKSNYGYRDSIAQILYGDCTRLAIKGWTLVAKYSDNTTEKFSSFRGRERKKIKTLLKNLRPDTRKSPERRRTHLCPRCTYPLIRDHFVCPICALQFKSKSDARKISLIYPGGGYFYTRHYLLASMDAIAETWLSVLLVLSVLDILKNVQGGLFFSIFVLLLLALEKAITIGHSNRFIDEFIPILRNIEPDPALLCAAQPSPLEENPQQTSDAGDAAAGDPDRILRLHS